MVIEELVKTVLAEMRQLAKTETVIGNPVAVGEVSIIPVSRLSIGFGAGGGHSTKEHGEGEATGGGASVEPVAFFVIRGNDVELVSINKQDAHWAKALKLVPQIFEKVRDMTAKSPETTGEESGEQ